MKNDKNDLFDINLFYYTITMPTKLLIQITHKYLFYYTLLYWISIHKTNGFRYLIAFFRLFFILMV